VSARGPLDSVDAGAIVERLVDLARDAAPEHLTAHEADGLQRLERARQDGRRRTRILRLASAACLAAAAALLVLRLRDRALTYVVANGSVSEGGYIAAGGTEATLRFSDRSELAVAAGARVRVSRLQADGATVMLEGGTLHARIHPEPHAAWTLDAGPYVVHVTGTEFDLGWRVDDQTFDLRLQKGSVVVEGPLAEPGVRVGPGQHLVANEGAGTLSLFDELNGHPAASDAPASPPAAGSSVAASPSAPPPPADGSVGAHPREPGAAPRGHGTPSWAARVAHGDFDGVIADAERTGADKVLAESSAGDLAALADAARYARRQDLARRALVAERARYAGTVQARDASFFLGGIAENQGDSAGSLQWYDVYLGENANGAYASQALGRKMVLVERMRGRAGAAAIASEYLARFPDGPYAATARKLLRAQ
jgi:hypothetical protein